MGSIPITRSTFPGVEIFSAFRPHPPLRGTLSRTRERDSDGGALREPSHVREEERRLGTSRAPLPRAGEGLGVRVFPPTVGEG